MKKFNFLSLKWKFILLTTTISALSLLVACFIFAYKDLNLFKKIYLNNLKNTASIIGQSSRAALWFGDKKVADQLLSSLKEEKQIHYAALINSQGEVFSDIGNSDYLEERAKKVENSFFFQDNGFKIDSPITLKNQKIGALVLLGELDEYKSIARDYLLFLIVTFVLVVGLVFFVSSKTHQFVTYPILSLAKTAKELSKNPDFSMRVEPSASGEIKVLYQAFNLMLSELQKRDNELLNYKEHLEEMVRKRTETLLRTNDILVKEIDEKKTIQNQLSHSLNEKEILLKEVQHRAKNNMQILSSLIWLQIQEMNDNCCAGKFEEFRNRVRSMALVHEKILESSNLKEINLSEYLNDFSRELSNAFFTKGKDINLIIKSEDIFLDMDKTLACGLILNELVSNSFKHGFWEQSQGNIEVVAKRGGIDKISIWVSDDGIGFPENFDFQGNGSLGLDIVKSLTKEKLGGQVLLSQNGKTKILIQFPEDKKANEFQS